MLNRSDKWIIVLGAPTENDGTASFVQQQRCKQAYELWEDNKEFHIVTMGAAVANSFIEAVTMREILIQYGVEESFIKIETGTVSTREQIFKIKCWIDKFDVTEISVVSDSMHIPRIKMLFKLANCELSKLTFVGSGYPKSFLKRAKRVFYEGVAGYNELSYFAFNKSAKR